METGVTLRKEGTSQRTIAPGESEPIQFTILSDGNANQAITIIANETWKVVIG